jgi:replication factor C subunit 3/5
MKSENLKYDLQVIEIIAMLAKGDLRKAINLLQSISMQSEYITSELCYETANIPTNYEIKKILSILNNKNIKFNEAYDIVSNLIKKQSYSLSIVLKELVIEIINNISNDTPIILSELSDLENMVTKSTFGEVYITALISIFKK